MSTTMHTRRTIDAVARNIRTKIETDLGGDYDYTAARQDNAAGWTIWFPAPLGGEVTHEGITLSDAELRRAPTRASEGGA